MVHIRRIRFDLPALLRRPDYVEVGGETTEGADIGTKVGGEEATGADFSERVDNITLPSRIQLHRIK